MHLLNSWFRQVYELFHFYELLFYKNQKYCLWIKQGWEKSELPVLLSALHQPNTELEHILNKIGGVRIIIFQWIYKSVKLVFWILNSLTESQHTLQFFYTIPSISY